MTVSINNFKELTRHIPLIQLCIDNPNLAKCQQVYNKYALIAVAEIVALDAACDYSWDPEASVKEFKIKQIISNFLHLAPEAPLTANHIFSYLKLNELEL